ncbi:MAG: flavin reductase family protein [Rubricoccaceae bacterium]
MDLTLADLSPRNRYKLLSALVVPRPIAWVTTLNADGSVNAAPFSFFNLMGNRPPVVALGPDDRPDGTPKDTPRNIRQTGRFVINVVSESVADAMHASSVLYPPGVSEVDTLELATAPMPGTDVPRLADAPAALACREHSTLYIGETRVVLGVVEHLFVRDELVDTERWRIDQEALRPVGRLGGGLYTRTRDHLDLGPRPLATAPTTKTA